MFFLPFFYTPLEELQQKALLLREEEQYKKATIPLKKALWQLQKKEKNSPTKKEDSLLQARICQQLGELFIILGHFTTAQEYIEKSLLLGREGNDQFPLWKSLKLLGELWLARGQGRLAIETLLNSLEKAKDDPEADLAGNYRSLGAAHSLLADYTQGVDYLHQALLSAKLNDSTGICQSFLRMGYICCHLGKTLQTREYINQIRKLQTKDGSLLAMATCLEGILVRVQGRPTKAIDLFERARATLQKHSLQRPLLRIEIERGLAYIALKDYPNLKKSLGKIQRKMGNFQAEDIHVIWGYLEASAEFMKGERESALDILNAHIAVAEEMNFGELLWQLAYLQGTINRELGNLKESREAYLFAIEKLKGIWEKLPIELKKDYLQDMQRKKVFQEAKQCIGE